MGYVFVYFPKKEYVQKKEFLKYKIVRNLTIFFEILNYDFFASMLILKIKKEILIFILIFYQVNILININQESIKYEVK